MHLTFLQDHPPSAKEAFLPTALLVSALRAARSGCGADVLVR
jgi:hypothetical protein